MVQGLESHFLFSHSQTVNVLIFAGHSVCIPTAHFHRHGGKAAIANTRMNECVWVPTRFYLQRLVVKWIWPTGHSLLTSALGNDFLLLTCHCALSQPKYIGKKMSFSEISPLYILLMTLWYKVLDLQILGLCYLFLSFSFSQTGRKKTQPETNNLMMLLWVKLYP